MSLHKFLGTPIKVPEDKILCVISEKLRNKTKEEEVRQKISKNLLQEYIYEKADIEIEFSIKIGSKRYPIDIAIFQEGQPHTQENIYIIIETKQEKIKSADRNEGIEQLKSYVSACLNCQFGLWTNGIDKFCFQKIDKDGVFLTEEIIDIPLKGKSLEEYEQLNFDELRAATDLKVVFKRCHNYIYANQGIQKTEAFHELLKVIFCKIYDELGRKIRFYVTNKERKTQFGLNQTKDRIATIFEEVKKYPMYRHIFHNQEEKITLEANVISYIVSQLQHYNLLQTDTDVKGDAYEEIVGSNLRGDRGEFFTPRPVTDLAVSCIFNMFPEKKWDTLTVLDPACGTGGFLVSVINFIRNHYFIRELEKWKDESKAREITKTLVSRYCENYLHGIDFNPLLVRATQMNEVMHGNGSGNLFRVNSLKRPTDWDDEIQNKIKIDTFDIILTNPPFGSKIPIDDPRILSQFDLGHSWSNKNFEMKNGLQSSVPPEELFIERCMQLLKPGGMLAIVLPDSILSNPGKKYIRYWMFQKFKILASIDLPRETFLPNVGTKTSLLLLQKKTIEDIRYEKETGKSLEYPVFMEVVDNVGYDRRGQPIYKMTPEGEIIYFEKEKEITKIKDKTIVKEKVIIHEAETLNELPDVALRFSEWIKDKIKT